MKKLYIEAGSLAEERISGVGHTALNIIKALVNNNNFSRQYKVILLVPFNKVRYIDDELRSMVHIRRVFVPGKIMNILVRLDAVPYMDIFFGKGIYLFPNFKNWPLKFSPSITYIHDIYFKIKPEHIEPRNFTFLNNNIERFILRANTVVTVSNHERNQIERYFPGSLGKVEVVYNGINLKEFYRRDIYEQRKVGEKYGVSPGRYFMFLSSIEPRKNIERVLDAYKAYVDEAEENRKVKLILIGGMGWNNGEFFEKIARMKASGYQVEKPSRYVPDSELPALLSGAIALVHPALYEGFGITPLEAAACGTRVIVAKNSSIPEVMGKQYSEYVDEYNVANIAARMAEYAESPVPTVKVQDELIAIAKKFTWEKSAERLYTIIEATYKR